MRKPDRPKSGQIFRCAIYTRISSNDGLKQEFDPLDAQREACEAYVTSQRHAGWIALPDMYDDGGLSGGTIERPALQRLLSDNDPKADAAIRFAVKVVREHGHVSEDDLRAVKSAGYDDAQVIEIVLHVALNTWTNYINEVAKTDIDFPVVAARAAH